MSDRACSYDKTRLVSFLYEEDGADEHRLVEAHLAACQECRAEVEAFRGVRAQLSAWAPPEEILGFRVVREPERPARWWWPLPAWAQAAAAVLVLMAGAALANLEIRYGADGLTVRTGWSRPAPTAAVPAPLPASDLAQGRQAPADGAEAWRTALASLEQQLRRDFGARPAVAAPPAATAAAADEQRLLARVREIVRESEDGLRSEFGVRLAGAVTELDTRRRADLVRIEESFGQLEGRAGIEAARTNNMLQYLMRVSQSGGTIIK